ncbi:MAG TPA: S9 family peptidase, partial [Luteimonas sp.]|nr:S9 family peptidase [Luteimonas sp.]
MKTIPLLIATSLLMTTFSACKPGNDAATEPAARATPLAVATAATPPDAEKRDFTVKAPHGAERGDEYYWLRDDKREDKAMLAYLDAENAYADAVLAPLKPLENTLYDEIVGRIKQDDSSIPARERGWWYYSRFEAGKDYPIHARRKDGAGIDALSIQAANERGEFAGEEVLLDVNALAQGKDYYSVGAYEISQDNNILAWADDTNGRRQYTFRFRDLSTGQAFPEEIRGTSGDLVFADDNRTVFYVENDPETLLTKRVKRHVIGTDPKDDAVVYEEKDDSFYMGVDRSRDDKYIVIGV